MAICPAVSGVEDFGRVCGPYFFFLAAFFFVVFFTAFLAAFLAVFFFAAFFLATVDSPKRRIWMRWLLPAGWDNSLSETQ